MGIIKRELYSIQQNALSLVCGYLNHPGRLKIILLLLTNESLTLGQIQNQLGLSQSACSDQVRILKDSGIIIGVNVGNCTNYSLNLEVWRDMVQLLYLFAEEMLNA